MEKLIESELNIDYTVTKDGLIDAVISMKNSTGIHITTCDPDVIGARISDIIRINIDEKLIN